jgi:hypothetical protein
MSSSPVDRLFDALNAQKPTRAAQQLDSSYRGVDATRSAVTVGRSAAHAEIQTGLEAFPAPTFTLHQRLTTPSHETVLWQMEAEHEGSFLQIPATNRSVTVRGMSMLSVRDDAITRGIHLWDLAGLLRAVNLLPDLPDPSPDANALSDLPSFDFST